MASWTPRMHSSSSQNDSISTMAGANVPSTSLSKPHQTSPLADVGIREHTYAIPSLQSSHDTRAASSNASKQVRNPSRHGRSMSHPFPSLFQSKKKRQGDKAREGLDSADEDQPFPKTSLPGKVSRVADQDLVSGRCMTCDSMVRWPKELVVFRCTVCMTINDLRPRVNNASRGDGNRSQIFMNSSKDAVFSKAICPLSNEKTSALVESCIISYLLVRLCHSSEALNNSLPTSLADSSEATGLSYPVGRDPITKTQIGEDDSNPISIRLQNRTVARRDASSDIAHIYNEFNVNPKVYSSSTPTSSEFHVSSIVEDLAKLKPGPPPVTPHNTPQRSHVMDHESEQQADIAPTPPQHRVSSSTIFKPLEDYIVASLLSRECINRSFTSLRAEIPPRAASEGTRQPMEDGPNAMQYRSDGTLSAMDAKTLLIGDFAENGSWWSGGRSQVTIPNRSRSYRKNNPNEQSILATDIVNMKSAKINWTELNDWYRMVLHPGDHWKRHWNQLAGINSNIRVSQNVTTREIQLLEDEIFEAQTHVQRVVLKATESLLKRPGAPLTEPDDIRFLLIILANPFLYSSHSSYRRQRSSSRSRSRNRQPLHYEGIRENPGRLGEAPGPGSSQRSRNGPGQHSGIIKRVLGLLSNLPNKCHHHLVSWFSRYPEDHFLKTTELIGSFVTYRLTKQHGRGRATKYDPTAGLVPNVASSGQGTSAALHAALGAHRQYTKGSDNSQKTVVYNDDWQIKAAARVMALLFSANNNISARRLDSSQLVLADGVHNNSLAARERAHRHGQILATSDFYNTLLDYSDLIADFEAWESKRGKFAFCQYPFFLSIWAKIQIMEHDARRQMEVKAREAFFDSIMTRKAVNQYLILKVRRECLVEDSLKGVSEVVGIGGEEIKKGLRIEFKGEEGIDAGGLRKEWFLLLVRDVFNPEHGMFTYDDESRCCYFNPNSFETSDQFFLVGVVLGLAIYNSTILDVALPPFAFRKLLAAGPTAAPGAPSHAKPTMVYSLEDLAEYRPILAYGLRQLLDFDGDVEETFCRDFVADVERYGQMVQVPLCLGGQSRPVTNSNRREFVDLYIRYLLDTAVTRQFEPFKRGFFTVCGGNALSLFRSEEIELLIRGSDEPLDITSLRAVSTCENWGSPNPAETEPVIGWFWDSFEKAKPKDQRKLLSFITGSDRIPAMGVANLVIKISCLGNDSSRFPVARTCFNVLSLWRYESLERLEYMLWRAVNESEGFGLK